MATNSLEREKKVPIRHSTARPGGRRGLAVTLGVVLVLSACGGDGDAGGDEAAAREEAEAAVGTLVTITNFRFEPQEIQVSPGTKVTWINKDSARHRIQDLSDLDIPISRELSEGYKYSQRYEKPGSYSYVCAIHPFMTGTVKVV